MKVKVEVRNVKGVLKKKIICRVFYDSFYQGDVRESCSYF